MKVFECIIHVYCTFWLYSSPSFIAILPATLLKVSFSCSWPFVLCSSWVSREDCGTMDLELSIWAWRITSGYTTKNNESPSPRICQLPIVQLWLWASPSSSADYSGPDLLMPLWYNEAYFLTFPLAVLEHLVITKCYVPFIWYRKTNNKRMRSMPFERYLPSDFKLGIWCPVRCFTLNKMRYLISIQWCLIGPPMWHSFIGIIIMQYTF